MFFYLFNASLDAVKNMSIADGFAILKGGDHAATDYLRNNTTSGLTAAFSPRVKESIDKVKVAQAWEPLTKAYNKAMLFTGGDPVNTDINAYVTELAIRGMFTLIAEEEGKIRKDPLARVSDLLKKVFGSPEAGN
ncbi:MAG: hypothetical protein COB15_14120 [Flavobacteriales bacterium]|nr:MAG: hypothetical protein COB15_14120 [Flavobacteriales bacterium]